MLGGFMLFKVAFGALLIHLTLTSQVGANFFDDFFGPGSGHGMFQREQEAPPTGDASWFEARVDAASCNQYLCPRTLSCVAKPSHCPCPFPQQVRCSYRETDPASLERSRKAGGSFDGVDAELDLGGTFCVTAENCDEVERMLQATSQS